MCKACLVVPLGSACSKSAGSRSMWWLDEECQRWPATSEPPDGLGSIKGPSERCQPDAKGSTKRTKQKKRLKWTRKKLIKHHTVQLQEKRNLHVICQTRWWELSLWIWDTTRPSVWAIIQKCGVYNYKGKSLSLSLTLDASNYSTLNDFFTDWTYKFTNNSIFF